MKTFVVLAVCCAAVAGCDSTDARIREKSAVYATLSPADQQTIRHGYITQGFTPDMVYMALDKPESVIPGPGPNEESWIYHNFYSRDGSTQLPPQKLVIHDGTNQHLGAVGPAVPGARSPGSNGSPVQMPGAIGTTGGWSHPERNYSTVEPDLAAEKIQVEAHIRVRVHFIDGKVTSIDIIRTA